MTKPIVAVCVATTGRPQILTETLRDVSAQTRRADRVLICPAKADDVDRTALDSLARPVEIVSGGIGLPAQRNTLLRAANDADIILFIDDDFLLAPTYISEMIDLFAAMPRCVVATGRVLADGATGPGYSVEAGRAIIAGDRGVAHDVAPVFNAYGCNMSLRWSALRTTKCWFDEELPLYAWAEDVDFSRQAAAYGDVLRSTAMTGVHLAAKSGKVSGVRFGYSQIANQVYLARKGTIPKTAGLRKALENLAANAAGSLRDNDLIDRRGRLAGNARGLLDVLIGRSHPKRILDL